jgi:hypothetical protein
MSVFGRGIRVQISRLQIGASAVIKAVAFIVTGAAQSELIISTTVNYFTRFVLFFGSCFLFSTGPLSEENLSIKLLLSMASLRTAQKSDDV